MAVSIMEEWKPWKKREYLGGFNVFKEDDQERPYLESGI